MSEHEDNGDNDPDEGRDSARSEAKRLAAIVEVCAVHAERSFLESQAAKKASAASLEAHIRTEKVLKNVMRAIKRLADDQIELRSGIPASWRDRFGLVVLVSVLSSVVAAAVVRLAS